MDKKLIIVESPNKIKTIQSYLGPDYEIIASYGHLRELNKKKGFDDKTFEPYWQIVGAKSKDSKDELIKRIVATAKKSSEIYLATDPDREGEAIAWHIYDLLPEKEKSKCSRITFNEVTQKAILAAIENKHEIDFNLVHSQFTRRILDRIIGYKLSSFIKYSLNAISAGRVQSVALLFVVERELERRAFVPSFWWKINAEIKNDVFIDFVDFKKQFESYKETTHSSIPFRFANEKEAQKVMSELSHKFTLTNISEAKVSSSEPLTPLTTDKLLQLASINLGWGTSKTTLVAQKLFEGVEYNNKTVALISYPRTDSERLNEDFVKEAQNYIVSNYGNNYFVGVNQQKKQKDANVQDAHEAIRPVDVTVTPSSLLNDAQINKDCVKLYNIIWTRTVASLMAVPSFNNYTLMFNNNNYEFVLTHKELLFDGYLALDFYQKTKKEFLHKLPNLKVGQEFETDKINLEKQEKSPPPYYTEATLVAALKESGVGRPSTYSTMARIGETRGYINKEKQKLIPNELGMNVIDLLTKNFSDVISKKFTADMENDLDKIASGLEDWKDPLIRFNANFTNEVKEAYNKIEKKENRIVEDQLCPECNAQLYYKVSRFNKEFVACSNFPKCKYTQSLEKIEYVEGRNCPECNSKLVYKTNKKGQKFIGCTGFPKCKHVESIK